MAVLEAGRQALVRPPPHQPSPGGSASPQGGSDPWERGRLARILMPLAVAELPCDAAASHQAGGDGNGQADGKPGRRSRLIAMGKDGRGCARSCAGGTPALPGGLHFLIPLATLRDRSASTARTATKWIMNIDAQDIQDLVLGVWCPVVPGIRKPGPDHRPSLLLVQEPHVLFIDVHIRISIPCAVPG